MNYTILPKKNYLPQLLSINKCIPNENEVICILSQSVRYYHDDVSKQLNIMKNTISNENFTFSKELEKITNFYEFLFTKVCGFNYSVSKLKPTHFSFYIYFELMHSYLIVDYFKEKNMNAIFFSPLSDVFIECLTILREDYNDTYHKFNLSLNQKDTPIVVQNNSIDLLYFDLMENICSENGIYENEVNLNIYISNSIKALYNTIVYQKYQGITIIKFDVLIHKPILDLVYLYTCFFEKVSIVKPLTSNVISNERFLVCKQYRFETPNYDFLSKIIEFTKLDKIQKLLSIDLPYYFLNKIEESNASIGYQQIEQMNVMMIMIKNKNKE